MNCDYSKDSTSTLICHRGLWIPFIILDAVVEIACVWNPFGVKHIEKAWRKLLWCLWDLLFQRMKDWQASEWVFDREHSYILQMGKVTRPSHLRTHSTGGNRWIQDDLSVHWVSDEEIMGVIWTYGSKSKAMNSSGENDFLEAKLSICKKESWQIQPGIGSLGLRRETTETTQQSCSWPQTLNGCSVIDAMMGIFISISSLFT